MRIAGLARLALEVGWVKGWEVKTPSLPTREPHGEENEEDIGKGAERVRMAVSRSSLPTPQRRVLIPG
ncbi:hypothetical protein FIBSPDRAFT_852004 [Athelia psychrophila]|uniref:Uncharacterized protein n=1 Tax=Athelia psychrophila TaxID=1759441 RepID=A0A166S8Z9_9AGAM|nr:hypothetical protein FIBSPDRAFT_852004 [Fibularhizoctonia sp. CBS 109695]